MYGIYRVYKKIEHLKQPQFKLTAFCCNNQTALNAWTVMIRTTAQGLIHLGIVKRYY